FLVYISPLSLHDALPISFVYGMLYAVFALFLLGLIPLMFGLPDIGNPLYVIMLMIPFLLATSFFGLTASLFFTDSDAPLLMIALDRKSTRLNSSHVSISY